MFTAILANLVPHVDVVVMVHQTEPLKQRISENMKAVPAESTAEATAVVTRKKLLGEIAIFSNDVVTYVMSAPVMLQLEISLLLSFLIISSLIMLCMLIVVSIV